VKLAQLEEELEKQKQEFSGMQDRKNVFTWLKKAQAYERKIIKVLDQLMKDSSKLDQLMKDSSKTNSNSNAKELDTSYRAFDKELEDFEGKVFKKFGAFWD
jgi:hypothetical protein